MNYNHHHVIIIIKTFTSINIWSKGLCRMRTNTTGQFGQNCCLTCEFVPATASLHISLNYSRHVSQSWWIRPVLRPPTLSKRRGAGDTELTAVPQCWWSIRACWRQDITNIQQWRPQEFEASIWHRCHSGIVEFHPSHVHHHFPLSPPKRQQKI